MAVLLVADVNDGALATDQVAKALAALTTLGEVHVLVAGTGGDAAAAEAATLAGVSKVLFADDHAYCHGMAEATAALVVGLAGGYSHICPAPCGCLVGCDGPVRCDCRDRRRHV